MQVIGVCNGFQILVEAGLLPGALMRNASLKFVCREVKLEVANANTAFTRDYAPGQIIRCPVAHHDGNYFADAETLARIEGEGQVVFRYAEGTNPNGSINDIAGIINEQGQCARPDAASRKPDRGRAWRHRRPRAVRKRARAAPREPAPTGARSSSPAQASSCQIGDFETMDFDDADASPLPAARLLGLLAACQSDRRRPPEQRQERVAANHGAGGDRRAQMLVRQQGPGLQALPHGQRAEFLQRHAALPAGAGEEYGGKPLLVVQAEGPAPDVRRSVR